MIGVVSTDDAHGIAGIVNALERPHVADFDVANKSPFGIDVPARTQDAEIDQRVKVMLDTDIVPDDVLDPARSPL